MLNRRVLLSLLVVSLLSFPLAAYASPSDPPSVVTASASSSGSTTTFNGNVVDHDLTEYGFQYGETDSYGSEVKGTEPLSEFDFVSQFGESGSGDGQFSYPTGITIDENGNLYVLDLANYRVQKFDKDGNFISKFGGTQGGGDGQFGELHDIAIDSNGNIFVVDLEHIQKFDSNGVFVSRLGGGWGSADGKFKYPKGIAISSSGDIFVADTGNKRIQKFDSNGVFISKFGSSGSGDGQFSYPNSIALDGSGNLFVADSSNRTIQKFDSNGIYISTLVSADNWFTVAGMAIDSNGNILTSGSSGSDRYPRNYITKYGPDGELLSDFRFKLSEGDEMQDMGAGLVFDSEDNLYAADSLNHRVQKFAPNDPGNRPFTLDVKGLDCETVYHYRAFATNTNGTSYGQDTTFTTDVCEGGPTNLVGNATSKTVALIWDSEQDLSNEARIAYRVVGSDTWVVNDQYGVYEGDSGGSFVVSGLLPDTTYDFRVANVPWDQTGSARVRSAWSNTLEISTQAQNTYTVSSCRELQAIGVDPITGVVGDQEGRYVLDRDIDCSESANWNWDLDVSLGYFGNINASGFFPIVDPNAEQSYSPSGFKGELDGRGYSISNIYQKATNFAGVFGVLDSAKISNIRFENLRMEVVGGAGMAGGLATASQGNTIIENVSIDGSMISVPSTDDRISGSFNSLAFNQEDNMYVGDWEKILVGNSIGELQNAFDEKFDGVSGIAFDSNLNVYVTDKYNSRVVKLDSNGVLLAQFGSQGSGELSRPSGIAIDHNDKVYVADSENSRVVMFDTNGVYLGELGTYGWGDGEFYEPVGIAFDSSNNVYVVDSSLGRVLVFDSNGVYLRQIASQGSGDGEVYYPKGLAVDSDNNVYVVDGNGRRIVMFDSNGVYVGLFGNQGSGDEKISYPVAIAFDNDENTYVIDDGRVKKFDSNGNYVVTITDEPMSMSVVGGVVGFAGPEGTRTSISNTFSNILIDLDLPSNLRDANIGGIFGIGSGDIFDSYSTGTINVLNEDFSENIIIAGGIAGYSESSHLDRTYSTMAISYEGEAMSAGGGLAGGFFGGSISNSYSTGQMNGFILAGGLVGYGGVSDGSAELDNNSFDQSSSQQESCLGMFEGDDGPIEVSDAMCLGVNADGTQNDYYFGNSQAGVFGTWNFGDIWMSHIGSHPTLRPIVLTEYTDTPPDTTPTDPLNTNDNSLPPEDITVSPASSVLSIEKVLEDKEVELSKLKSKVEGLKIQQEVSSKQSGNSSASAMKAVPKSSDSGLPGAVPILVISLMSLVAILGTWKFWIIKHS